MVIGSDIQTAYEPATTVSTPLRVYRVASGLTQAQLAKRAACSRITIGALERRENVPQLETARRLAAALDVEIEVIFPDDERRPAQDAVREEPAEDGPTNSG